MEPSSLHTIRPMRPIRQCVWQNKIGGDLAIQSNGGDYLILRTSWVYGARGSNLLLTMLGLAQERSELRIVDDQIGAPPSSECIAQTRQLPGTVAGAIWRRAQQTQWRLLPYQCG